MLRIILAALAVCSVAGMAHANVCRASVYWEGTRTASGERFRPDAEMTAAHRTLPFGTMVRVTYQNRSVVVRISDRGPFVAGRCLDLSRLSGRKLGILEAGVVTVSYKVI